MIRAIRRVIERGKGFCLSRGATILVCSPPGSAIGGIAAHTSFLLNAMEEASLFNEWWPVARQPRRGFVRLAVHALGFLRFGIRLTFARPHLIHLQVSQSGIARDIAYAVTAGAFGIPVASHLHSEFREPNVGGLRRLLGASTVVFVLSEATRDRIVHYYPDVLTRIKVLPNPVNPDFLETPVPAQVGVKVRIEGRTERLTLLMVGRITPTKGQARVSEVVENLHNQGVSIRLLLVGPLSDVGSEVVTRLRSNSATCVLGPLRGSDLIRAFDAADALVVFSETEGEPLVVLEAMARRLPVVATDVGNIRHMLPSYAHNRVISPGDEQGLVGALSYLIDEVPNLHETGEANRRWVEKTRSVSTHVRALRAGYPELEGSRVGGGAIDL